MQFTINIILQTFFEIEIDSSPQDLKVYSNDFGGRYVSAFLSLQTKFASCYRANTFNLLTLQKKRVGLLDLLILSPFSENKTNSQILHKLYAK